MSSTLGTLYKISTFGESHSKAVGVVIDGCPAGIDLPLEVIQKQLSRRKPGQNKLTTQRKEDDEVQVLSGIENGKTLGTPICLIVNNKDQRPGDYKKMSDVPRPSHADFTYQKKFGIRASSGGGRASARETIGSVAAGAIADFILKTKFDIDIIAYVSRIEKIDLSENFSEENLSREIVDESLVRCPDKSASEKMVQRIEEIKSERDSIGGVITCVVKNVPVGLGEPVFEKLEAKLAQVMMAIPATKGFEIGSGFKGSKMKGSEHNDLFEYNENKLQTTTNNSGGIQGGISNGEEIYFKVAFKPTATIALPQDTSDFEGNKTVIEGKGRHDACVVPRAVPIVEAMAGNVILDMLLRQNARQL
ncbi:MAG: chorismate synthase [Rhodothermaceae bacterium]